MRRNRPPRKLRSPFRKWSDKSGKFSIEARLDVTSGENVVLVKQDGKRLTVPLEKLCDADQEYVKGFDEKNPFAEPTTSDSFDASSKSEPLNSAHAKGAKADWSGVKSVRPQTFAKWTYRPAGVESKPEIPSAGGKNVDVTLADVPDSEQFFENVHGVYVSDDGSRAVVCRERGEVSQDRQQFVELVDFKKGESKGLSPLPKSIAVLDVLPDAGLVMYRPEAHGFANETTLTIAEFTNGQITPKEQWVPYIHEDWEPRRDIDKGWFLSRDRVMTINRQGGALTVWDVEGAKALLSIPVANSIGLKMALSPDRRMLAIVMKDGIAMVDLVAGRHVATISTKGKRIDRIAYPSDNARLAALSDEGATVWDLTNGKVLQEFYHGSIRPNADLKWVGDLLLVDNRYLYDVGRRILLWEYESGSHWDLSAQLQRGQFWIVSKPQKGQATTLVSTPMPHATALEELAGLPSAEELLVVRPGDAVAIEVDIDPGISLPDDVRRSLTADLEATGVREKQDPKVVVLNPAKAQGDLIRQSLAARLQAAGLRVVDHADLVVKAVCKPQPQQTIRVNVDGRFPVRKGDIVERTVTPHASYLQMSLGNEVLWKRGFVAQPGMLIVLMNGESLDQALARITKPNIRLFTNAKFSAYVAKPGKANSNGAYGVSQFTAHGLIDGKSSGAAAFE